jgi:hypothetical protein
VNWKSAASSCFQINDPIPRFRFFFFSFRCQLLF